MDDDRRIRVVQVIARLNVGGPAALVLSVAEGLDPDSFESVVLHGDVARGETDWAAVRGAPPASLDIRRVEGLGRDLRASGDARALATLVGVLRRLKPDVVHTHTAKAGVLGRMAARIAGSPAVVHTFHGHVLHGYFSPRLLKGIVATERTLARRTDRIVAVGAGVRDELLDAGIGRPEQYRVIGPGVDPMPLPSRGVARERLGLPPEKPVVAMIGRLTQIKRPDRAIDVLARVRSAGIDAHLVLAGDGDLRAQVERQAAVLGDHVTFLGWTADVASVLAAADVVLLSSDNEGMPVTLAEAAQAGVAVVASDVGGVAEIVLDGRTGLVVAPTTDALAEALGGLLADPQTRIAMGRRAMVHAERHLTTSTLVAAHQELYREVTT